MTLASLPTSNGARSTRLHLTPQESLRREAAFELAQHWLALGAELVPLQPRSKYIVTGYGPTKRKLTTLNQLRYRIDQGFNIGLVLGGAGRIACLDFESVKLYEEWRDAHGFGILTWTERTARGVHVFFKAVGPDPLTHCALPKQIDFLTSTVVTLAPSVHSSGALYHVLERHPLATLSRAQQTDVIPFAPRPTPPAQRTETALKGEGERAPLMRAGTSFRALAAEIRRRRPVSAEALRVGVQGLTNRGDQAHLWKGRCPFHDGNDPDSMWLDDRSGLWGCASTNCRDGHREQGAHDVITMRALADGVTPGRAIVTLARELGLIP